MSDHADEKKDKKDDKKAAPAAAAAAGGGMKAMLGPVAAVVVLLAAGGGTGYFIANAVKPAAVAGSAADAHDTDTGHDTPDAGHGAQILTDIASPLPAITLKTNVTGQGGNRYATATVTLWVDKSITSHFTEPPMLALLQSKMEEQFKAYSFEELNGATIHQRSSKDFKLVAERLMRSLHKGKHDPKVPEKPLVSEVVITDLLVQ